MKFKNNPWFLKIPVAHDPICATLRNKNPFDGAIWERDILLGPPPPLPEPLPPAPPAGCFAWLSRS